MGTSAKVSIAIELEHVSKQYGKKTALRDVNVRFESNAVHLVVGINGSGKSTLLKCIMGLIRYEGVVHRPHFRIGYAPEEYVMPHYMTVIDFLEGIATIRSPLKEGLREEISSYLEYYGLASRGRHPIGKLSNGMRQKVNLIQAFLLRPKIILLDEPLRALDTESQIKTIGLIKERMTESLILVSTHNPDLFKIRARRVWRMNSGMMEAN
jgi:ABC-2 type transport system ATP-binding protein